MYNSSADAILIQRRCVQSVVSLEKQYDQKKLGARNSLRTYSRVPRKRACMRYLIFTKLPLSTFSFVSACLFIFWIHKAFFNKSSKFTGNFLQILSTITRCTLIRVGRRGYLNFAKIPPYMLIRVCTLIWDTWVISISELRSAPLRLPKQ